MEWGDNVEPGALYGGVSDLKGDLGRGVVSLRVAEDEERVAGREESRMGSGEEELLRDSGSVDEGLEHGRAALGQDGGNGGCSAVARGGSGEFHSAEKRNGVQEVRDVEARETISDSRNRDSRHHLRSSLETMAGSGFTEKGSQRVGLRSGKDGKRMRMRMRKRARYEWGNVVARSRHNRQRLRCDGRLGLDSLRRRTASLHRRRSVELGRR